MLTLAPTLTIIRATRRNSNIDKNHYHDLNPHPNPYLKPYPKNIINPNPNPFPYNHFSTLTHWKTSRTRKCREAD